jgi:hypothetical protein
MALQKMRNSSAYFTKETTFKEASPTFTSADVIPYIECTWSANTEVLNRDIKGSATLLEYLPEQGLETSSGTIQTEITVASDATDWKFVGHTLFEAALGGYNGETTGAAADVSTVGTVAVDTDTAPIAGGSALDNLVPTVGTNTPTTAATLYYFSLANLGTVSLATEYQMGGMPTTPANIDNTAVQVRGIVVESLQMTFPQQGIITTDFSLQGSTGLETFGTDNVQPSYSESKPFIARNLTVEIDGASYCLTEMDFTVTNEIADKVCLTDTGVTENNDELDKFNAWGSFKLYISGTNADGDTLYVEIPNALRTSFDYSDENGIYAQNVGFTIGRIDDIPLKIALVKA